ncbi:hypothetical protein BT63DRAFT_449835 [Microthyrium microscopicum]|uniref:Uncharacterized protein n=1 Tax=Microthyrium microscopicum TaxID=703497 RepID=A0A6A6UTN6_9PEZI|nr:hypothetical protein BT63DRAFT_449835 [Microthyrium microscopicum]
MICIYVRGGGGKGEGEVVRCEAEEGKAEEEVGNPGTNVKKERKRPGVCVGGESGVSFAGAQGSPLTRYVEFPTMVEWISLSCPNVENSGSVGNFPNREFLALSGFAAAAASIQQTLADRAAWTMHWRCTARSKLYCNRKSILSIAHPPLDWIFAPVRMGFAAFCGTQSQPVKDKNSQSLQIDVLTLRFFETSEPLIRVLFVSDLQ